MSTKLFNGYYIEQCNLKQLHKFSLKLREKMQEKEKEIYVRLLVNSSVYIYDKRNLIKVGYYELPKGEIEYKGPYSAFFRAYYHISDRFNKVQHSMTRDVDYDLSCNVTVIPTKTKILALIYAEQKEYHEVFESFKNVYKYPYWDNTDRPNDMTQKEWNARGREWDNALKPNDIPAMSGFGIECVPIFIPHVEKDELFSLCPMPAFENRILIHANRILSDRFFKRTITGDTTPITEIVPRVSEWIEYKESEEGKSELDKLEEEIKIHFKHLLTYEDLIEDYKEEI